MKNNKGFSNYYPLIINRITDREHPTLINKRYYTEIGSLFRLHTLLRLKNSHFKLDQILRKLKKTSAILIKTQFKPEHKLSPKRDSRIKLLSNFLGLGLIPLHTA